MILDWDAIYTESQGEIFSRGKKRFYDNAVSRCALVVNDGKPNASGVVCGGNGERQVSITFDEQGGLYDYSCSCGECFVTTGPCRHVVALALACEEKFPQRIIATDVKKVAKTDTLVFTLSSEYSKKRHIRKRAKEEGQVSLIPTLGLKGGSKLYLRFAVGKSRAYNVKDISDFVSAYIMGSHRRFGIKLDFDVVTESFEAKSKVLMEFLVASYREKVEISHAFNMGFAQKDELIMFATDVENFFEMYDGQLIDFEEDATKKGFRQIVSGVDNFDAVIKVAEGDGGFYISTNLRNTNIIYGKKYNFLIGDSRIYRATPTLTDAVMPLLKALDVHGKLFVIEKDMAIFYNSVLALVNKHIQIDSPDRNLLEFEAPPFTAKVYLDKIDGGGLVAKIQALYDDKQIDILDENFMPDMVRDWETERGFKSILAKFFPFYPDLTLTNEWEIYNFLKGGVSEIYKYADVYFADEVKRIKIKRPPKIKIGVRLDADLLKVDLNAEEYSSHELRAILDAHRDRKSYIRLSDGSFVDLTDQSLQSLGEIFSLTTQANDSELVIPKYYAPFLDTELKSGMFSFDRDSAFKILINSLKSASEAEIEVPALLKDILRSYQRTGFRWLKTLSNNGFGGILADDMGLGKTLQVVSLLLSEPDNKNIIVCPTSLILNWVDEFKKFAPHIKVLAVMGNYEERKALIATAGEYDVVVTSYELLRRDADNYGEYRFSYAIVDEAQYIKNPETKNAIAVKKINATNRFALTGTPIENSLSELWSIFDFIMPNYLPDYATFKEQYETEILQGNTLITDKFKKMVAPFILRRIKKNVLPELPAKVETVINSALTGEQRKLYKANFNLIKDSVKSADGKVNKIVVLSMLTKLRQICCEPNLVYADYEGNSAKFESCLELLESAVGAGHKILLFSQFTQMIERLRKALVERGISNYVLKGDTAKVERMRLVNKFNSDDTSVFLISLKAGGTGLNLTGADVVIHYDPWWNESVMNQATDRAYRIGQNKSVQVYKLVLKDTIEENIVELQQKKTDLSNSIIGDATAIAVSYDDLMKMFS